MKLTVWGMHVFHLLSVYFPLNSCTTSMHPFSVLFFFLCVFRFAGCCILCQLTLGERQPHYLELLGRQSGHVLGKAISLSFTFTLCFLLARQMSEPLPHHRGSLLNVSLFCRHVCINGDGVAKRRILSLIQSFYSAWCLQMDEVSLLC